MSKKSIIGTGIALTALAGTLGCSDTSTMNEKRFRTDGFVNISVADKLSSGICEGKTLINEQDINIKINYNNHGEYIEACRVCLTKAEANGKLYTVEVFDLECRGIADVVTIYEDTGSQAIKTAHTATREQLKSTPHLGYLDRLATDGLILFLFEDEIGEKAMWNTFHKLLND